MCWEQYCNRVVAQCPTFAYFLTLTAKVGQPSRYDTVVKRLQRVNASYVAIPQRDGTVLILSSQKCYEAAPIGDSELRLRRALQNHDRAKRIRSSQDINAGQRQQTNWRLVGLMTGDFERLIRWTEEKHLIVTGSGVESIFIHDASDEDIEDMIEAVGQ